MNKFFGYALLVMLFSTGTSWVKMITAEPREQSGSSGRSGWSSNSGSWGSGGGGGGGHK